MHHYRVNVSGQQATVERLVAELVGGGATPTDPDSPRCLVTASTRGLEAWRALSARYPDAVLGLEYFEAYEAEFLQVVITSGAVTVMARRDVLPDSWGGYHEEDGEPLSEDLLRAAAEAVAAQRLELDVGTLAAGLDIALTMGKALGRLCQRLEPTVFEDPPREALDAVVQLAVVALWVSTSASSTARDACCFEHALTLTRSMVHAGRTELWDQPGDASWNEWLQILIGSASSVIDAACHDWTGEATESHAVGSEHHGTAGELVELAAASLITTCLQALALFDPAPGSAAPAS